MSFIGVDLGGTKVAGVLVDDRGQVVDEVWRGHRVVADNNALALIEETITELCAAAERRTLPVDGIGVSIAGWLDVSRTEVVEAANLALTGIALRDVLASSFARPVQLLNDGDATLLAEVANGVVPEDGNAVLLTLGTGVGGGVLMSGRLAVGARGIAGELGHLPVTSGGELCVCGGRGCLELAVSGVALGKIARRLLVEGRLGTTDGEAVTAKDLGDAARAGQQDALQALQHAAEALATAVRIFIPTLDPDLVILGGSVVEGLGDVLVPLVRDQLAEHPWPVATQYPPPPVVTASVRRNGAAVGAAFLARRHDDVSRPTQKEIHHAQLGP